MNCFTFHIFKLAQVKYIVRKQQLTIRVQLITYIPVITALSRTSLIQRQPICIIAANMKTWFLVLAVTCLFAGLDAMQSNKDKELSEDEKFKQALKEATRRLESTRGISKTPSTTNAGLKVRPTGQQNIQRQQQEEEDRAHYDDDYYNEDDLEYTNKDSDEDEEERSARELKSMLLQMEIDDGNAGSSSSKKAPESLKLVFEDNSQQEQQQEKEPVAPHSARGKGHHQVKPSWSNVASLLESSQMGKKAPSRPQTASSSGMEQGKVYKMSLVYDQSQDEQAMLMSQKMRAVDPNDPGQQKTHGSNLMAEALGTKTRSSKENQSTEQSKKEMEMQAIKETVAQAIKELENYAIDMMGAKQPQATEQEQQAHNDIAEQPQTEMQIPMNKEITIDLQKDDLPARSSPSFGSSSSSSVSDNDKQAVSQSQNLTMQVKGPSDLMSEEQQKTTEVNQKSPSVEAVKGSASRKPSDDIELQFEERIDFSDESQSTPQQQEQNEQADHANEDPLVQRTFETAEQQAPQAVPQQAPQAAPQTVQHRTGLMASSQESSDLSSDGSSSSDQNFDSRSELERLNEMLKSQDQIKSESDADDPDNDFQLPEGEAEIVDPADDPMMAVLLSLEHAFEQMLTQERTVANEAQLPEDQMIPTPLLPEQESQVREHIAAARLFMADLLFGPDASATSLSSSSSSVSSDSNDYWPSFEKNLLPLLLLPEATSTTEQTEGEQQQYMDGQLEDAIMLKQAVIKRCPIAQLLNKTFQLPEEQVMLKNQELPLQEQQQLWIQAIMESFQDAMDLVLPCMEPFMATLKLWSPWTQASSKNGNTESIGLASLSGMLRLTGKHSKQQESETESVQLKALMELLNEERNKNSFLRAYLTAPASLIHLGESISVPADDAMTQKTVFSMDNLHLLMHAINSSCLLAAELLEKLSLSPSGKSSGTVGGNNALLSGYCAQCLSQRMHSLDAVSVARIVEAALNQDRNSNTAKKSVDLAMTKEQSLRYRVTDIDRHPWSETTFRQAHRATLLDTAAQSTTPVILNIIKEANWDAFQADCLLLETFMNKQQKNRKRSSQAFFNSENLFTSDQQPEDPNSVQLRQAYQEIAARWSDQGSFAADLVIHSKLSQLLMQRNMSPQLIRPATILACVPAARKSSSGNGNTPGSNNSNKVADGDELEQEQTKVLVMEHAGIRLHGHSIFREAQKARQNAKVALKQAQRHLKSLKGEQQEQQGEQEQREKEKPVEQAVQEQTAQQQGQQVQAAQEQTALAAQQHASSSAPLSASGASSATSGAASSSDTSSHQSSDSPKDRMLVMKDLVISLSSYLQLHQDEHLMLSSRNLSFHHPLLRTQKHLHLTQQSKASTNTETTEEESILIGGSQFAGLIIYDFDLPYGSTAPSLHSSMTTAQNKQQQTTRQSALKALLPNMSRPAYEATFLPILAISAMPVDRPEDRVADGATSFWPDCIADWQGVPSKEGVYWRRQSLPGILYSITTNLPKHSDILKQRRAEQEKNQGQNEGEDSDEDPAIHDKTPYFMESVTTVESASEEILKFLYHADLDRTEGNDYLARLIETVMFELEGHPQEGGEQPSQQGREEPNVIQPSQQEQMNEQPSEHQEQQQTKYAKHPQLSAPVPVKKDMLLQREFLSQSMAPLLAWLVDAGTAKYEQLLAKVESATMSFMLRSLESRTNKANQKNSSNNDSGPSSSAQSSGSSGPSPSAQSSGSSGPSPSAQSSSSRSSSSEASPSAVNAEKGILAPVSSPSSSSNNSENSKNASSKGNASDSQNSPPAPPVPQSFAQKQQQQQQQPVTSNAPVSSTQATGSNQFSSSSNSSQTGSQDEGKAKTQEQKKPRSKARSKSQKKSPVDALNDPAVIRKMLTDWIAAALPHHQHRLASLHSGIETLVSAINELTSMDSSAALAKQSLLNAEQIGILRLVVFLLRSLHQRHLENMTEGLNALSRMLETMALQPQSNATTQQQQQQMAATGSDSAASSSSSLSHRQSQQQSSSTVMAFAVMMLNLSFSHSQPLRQVIMNYEPKQQQQQPQKIQNMSEYATGSVANNMMPMFEIQRMTPLLIEYLQKNFSLGFRHLQWTSSSSSSSENSFDSQSNLMQNAAAAKRRKQEAKKAEEMALGAQLKNLLDARSSLHGLLSHLVGTNVRHFTLLQATAQFLKANSSLPSDQAIAGKMEELHREILRNGYETAAYGAWMPGAADMLALLRGLQTATFKEQEVEGAEDIEDLESYADAQGKAVPKELDVNAKDDDDLDCQCDECKEDEAIRQQRKENPTAQQRRELVWTPTYQHFLKPIQQQEPMQTGQIYEDWFGAD